MVIYGFYLNDARKKEKTLKIRLFSKLFPFSVRILKYSYNIVKWWYNISYCSLSFPRISIKTSNFNKNITHSLLGIHKKQVILQPAIEYKVNIKNKEL